jgi:hypothetical protein
VPDNRIIEFVTGGPKNYAWTVVYATMTTLVLPDSSTYSSLYWYLISTISSLTKFIPYRLREYLYQNEAGSQRLARVVSEQKR